MSTDFQTAALSNATNPPADPAADPFADHLGSTCRTPGFARTNAHYTKVVGGRTQPYVLRADTGHPEVAHGFGEATVHWHQGELWTAIGDYRSGGEVRRYNARLHALRRWTAAELGIVPGEGHRLYMAINAAGRMAIAYTDAADRLSYIAGFDLPDLTPAFGPTPLINPFDADEPVEIDDFNFDIMNLIAVTPDGHFVLGDSVTRHLLTFSSIDGSPKLEPHLYWSWPHVPAMTAGIIAAHTHESIRLRNLHSVIQIDPYLQESREATHWVRWEAYEAFSTVAVDPLTSQFVVVYNAGSQYSRWPLKLQWLDVTPGDPAVANGAPIIAVTRTLDLSTVLPVAPVDAYIDLLTVDLDGTISFSMKYPGPDGRADYATVAIHADGTLRYFKQPSSLALSDLYRYAHLPQLGQGRSDPAAGAY